MARHHSGRARPVYSAAQFAQISGFFAGANPNYRLRQYRSRRFLPRLRERPVRAFLTARYKPGDNTDVMDKLYEMGYGDRMEVDFLTA